jgi:hypothetical protein
MLYKMADNDQNQKMDHEFVGEFNKIKIALNNIIENLNSALG